MAIYSLYAYHNFEEAKHSQEDNVSHFEVAMDTLESFTPNISFLNSTKVPVYITTLGKLIRIFVFRTYFQCLDSCFVSQALLASSQS